MTNLSNKILDKIETNNIHPNRKVSVIAKRIGIWTLAITALIIGSLGAAVIIFVLANQDWDIYTRFSDNRALFALLILPYFWFILLGASIILGYYFFRHTKKGYRYSIIIVAIVYIVITFGLGTIFYNLGIGNNIEEVFAHNIDNYNRIAQNRAIWTHPERGLLAGEIISADTNQIIIEDLLGRKWQIDTSSTTGRGFLNLGADIKILGELNNSKIFRADNIRPWCGCAGCMQHRGESCTQHCRLK